MILVDANIPMYLVGTEHPFKHRAEVLLEKLLDRRERLVTDAEVIQEILHRYAAIGRREAIQPAIDALSLLVDEVLPITRDDVLHARDILLARHGLSARDAIHAAVMERHGISRILSFDSGYGVIPGVERLY